MGEMQDVLRSCMEKLIIAREEREQIIIEAANEISSEQRKVRDLQLKLEDANRKAAKLAAENGSLLKAADAKDKLIRELREAKSTSDDKLAAAKAELDVAQKQSASLQYEVRMLQKELEIRGEEREYDLKSADAARRQQAENQGKIAALEGECQRLRAMVRKRLPGPAALAKMRDEVEHAAGGAGAARRPRSATPMSPRSVTPMSPRSVAPTTPRPMTPMSSSSSRPMTPRRAPPEPERHAAAARLRAVEDENKALKQTLAKRDGELQFVQMRYADEACKLAAVQRQLKDLTEENKQLSDAHGQSESWASALISELEHFRAGKQGTSAMASDMSLLDDFAEIERLEMASSGDQASRPSRSSPRKADSVSATMSEKNGKDPVQNGAVSNGHPEWVQNIQKLVMHKHEASGKSVDTIVQRIIHALDQGAIPVKEDASDSSYDRAEIEKMVNNLVEKITTMIRSSAENGVDKREPFLHNMSEFCARLEYLVHVCYEVLHGKANLEKFIGEVCLVLEYIVSQCCSKQDRSSTVDSNTKNFDGGESLSTGNANSELDKQNVKSATDLDIQAERNNKSFESAESQITDHILVDHQESHLDEELSRVILDQDSNIHPVGMSSYLEIASPAADGSAENLTEQKEKQIARMSEISAAADKLAECQATISNLSRQLRALKSPASSGTLDTSLSNPRPSSAKSDYKPQSLASILAEENNSITEVSTSPRPKEVHSKQEEHDEPDHAALETDGEGEEPTQTVVHPVFPESQPRQQEDNVSADPKKKKWSPSLLGRMIFRKRVEDSS